MTSTLYIQGPYAKPQEPQVCTVIYNLSGVYYLCCSLLPSLKDHLLFSLVRCATFFPVSQWQPFVPPDHRLIYPVIALCVSGKGVVHVVHRS